MKENWEEKENLYARVSKEQLTDELGKGLIFDGNAKGKSLEDDGIRKLTTKMFDASGGGTLRFKVKCSRCSTFTCTYTPCYSLEL